MDTMHRWFLVALLAVAGPATALAGEGVNDEGAADEGEDEGAADEGEDEPPEMIVTRRVRPIYPQMAYAAEYAEVECKTRVFIDAKGAPTRVQFVECPELFRESARTALMQWRWKPARGVDGVATDATFPLVIRYKLRHPETRSAAHVMLQAPTALVIDPRLDQHQVLLTDLTFRRNKSLPAPLWDEDQPVRCRIRVFMDATGRFEDARILHCPNKRLERRSLLAIKSWRIRPPRVDGEKVACTFEATFKSMPSVVNE